MSDTPTLKKHCLIASKIAESSRKRKPKRLNPGVSRLCGHCNKKLSLKAFKKHEKLYKKPDQTWIANDIDAVPQLQGTSGSCKDQG